MAAKYNHRIWEVIKEKVLEVIHEELDKALTQTTSEEPAPQSEGAEA